MLKRSNGVWLLLLQSLLRFLFCRLILSLSGFSLGIVFGLLWLSQLRLWPLLSLFFEGFLHTLRRFVACFGLRLVRSLVALSHRSVLHRRFLSFVLCCLTLFLLGYALGLSMFGLLLSRGTLSFRLVYELYIRCLSRG